MNLQRLYIESPPAVKRMAGQILRLVPRSLIFGGRYRKVRAEVAASQFLPAEVLEKMQFARLKEMVAYAYRTVSYYKRVFDAAGIEGGILTSRDGFRRIPLMDKDTVRAHFQELQSVSFDRARRSYATTGGTSGQPLGFYIDKSRSQVEWAFLTTMWERIGYTIDDRRLVLRGEVIKKTANQLYFHDPLLNQLSLSTFHMTEENLWEYHRLIRDFRPHVIHGYPSAIVVYARFLRKHGLKLDFKLKGIVAISENILPAQRKYIEETFQTRFFSFYGHSEKLILAGECEESDSYHIEPLYGYTEILDREGNPVTGEGEVGELVGTGFMNHAMPFVRYRTGDLVEVATGRCPCGRNYPRIRSVRGRWLQEMLVTKGASIISITALNLHSDVFDRVAQFQFEQREPGVADLKIVRGDGYTERDGLKIVQELNAKLDDQIALNLVYVDEIAATSAGKSVFLRQHLDTARYFPGC